MRTLIALIALFLTAVGAAGVAMAQDASQNASPNAAVSQGKLAGR